MFDNGSILLLTGPPGAGKSTVGRLLAARARQGVHLRTDAFWGFIVGGYIDPITPEARAQNAMVMDVVCAAAARYSAAGSLVVVDGILVPGRLYEPLRDGLERLGRRVLYRVLRAPLPVCVHRAASRAEWPLRDASRVELLWQAFADLGPLESHAITTGDTDPDAVADQIESDLSD